MSIKLTNPSTKNQHHTHRQKVILTSPGNMFFADCLKVTNHSNAPYDYLLIFVDGFSNFCIAQAYKHPMTNEKFLEIFMEKVYAYYPNVKHIWTDNSKDISGAAIQQSLNLLGIQKVTISPHSHKSNYSELLIRYITYAIKINIQEKCIPPSAWYKILPLALVSLNNTNYSRLNYSISPQIINTGTRADFNCSFGSLEDDYLTQSGFSNYAVSLNKNQYVNFYLLTQLGKEQDVKNQKTHAKKDTNKIEPGNLVYKIDKALNLKGFSKKLRPRFTKLYLVLCTTSTATYIQIYKQDINSHKELLTFEQFLHNPQYNKSKVLPNFQVEKSRK